MSKYCPTGNVPCPAFGDCAYHAFLADFEQCPWPSRQKPVVANECTDCKIYKSDFKTSECYDCGYRKGQEDTMRAFDKVIKSIEVSDVK